MCSVARLTQQKNIAQEKKKKKQGPFDKNLGSVWRTSSYPHDNNDNDDENNNSSSSNNGSNRQTTTDRQHPNKRSASQHPMVNTTKKKRVCPTPFSACPLSDPARAGPPRPLALCHGSVFVRVRNGFPPFSTMRDDKRSCSTGADKGVKEGWGRLCNTIFSTFF